MALLLTQEAAANAANKESAEAQEKNNELLRKVDELQDIVQRLEAKVANLESEIQVLRQQAIAISPTAGALRLPTIIQDTSRVLSKELESEEKPQKLLNEEQQNTSPILSKKFESGEELQKSLNYEKQQENQDLLIKCITEDIGFSGGRPVAACLIYKCLLHWRSFEDERTDIFDRIIQTIDSAIEDNTDTLSYWLSNSCTLLLLLQRTLQASGPASLTPQRQIASSSLFGRMQGIRSSPQSAGLPFFSGHMGLSDVRQVEAKCPAMLFKQQLTAILENIYRWIRYNLKEEISPWLEAPPSTSRASLVKSLTKYLEKLKANYVPPFLVRKVFTQTFSFINVQLFNSLLLKREYCSFSNGEYVKAGLAELEHWCFDATEEYAGSAWDELKHIRQAVGFLVIHKKPKKTLKEITNNLCPVLNIPQLYRISTMYWDDKYGTNSVSSDVISSMRTMMTEDSNGAFLLDDDSSIPFSVDDISNSVTEIEVAEVDPPPLLRQNSGFAFLLQRKD